MTTKIEITITDNDNVIFVYMYKEQTLIDKFEIPKRLFPDKSKSLIKNVCNSLTHSLGRILKSMIEGGD